MWSHNISEQHKRAGGISPPMENQHTSQPNGGLTLPARWPPLAGKKTPQNLRPLSVIVLRSLLT